MKHEECSVALLVPHPTRQAVLTSRGTDASPGITLPVFSTTLDPSLPDVLAAATDLLGAGVVPLRVIALDVTADYEVTSMLVETESIAAASPTHDWVDLDEDMCTRLEPAGSRAAVRAFLREREQGWSHLRPQWSRPGWFARASAWMTQQLAEAGAPANEAPKFHQLWGLSAVLRACSDAGDVYLKCSADVFRHEAELTQLLARHMPGLVPDVLSVDSVAGWLLMSDLGGTALGEQDHSRWGGGLETLAQLQQVWLTREDELADLGLAVRSITALAEEIRGLADDDQVMARLGPELREQWLVTAPELVQACLRLDEIGPGPTIVHGDFHPWNVVGGDAGVRIFDWTDAAIAHPFVDLATYVTRTKDVGVRRSLLETYLAAWEGALPPQRLREAGELAVVVGTLYQVQGYRLILPTLLPGDLLDDSDVDWMKKSLMRHRFGLNHPS